VFKKKVVVNTGFSMGARFVWERKGRGFHFHDYRLFVIRGKHRWGGGGGRGDCRMPGPGEPADYIGTRKKGPWESPHP